MGRVKGKGKTMASHPGTGGPSNAPETSSRPPSPGAASSEPTESMPEKLDLILKEIRESRSALELQIVTLTTGLTLLGSDHGKLADTVKEHDRTLKDLDPQLAANTTTLQHLQQQVTGLQGRVEDAEGRNRCNNIRVIGLPERSEGGKAADFIAAWFKEYLAQDGFSPYFCVERAQGIPTGAPKPGVPPRPLIVKILNYRDRDVLLQKAMEKTLIQYENHRISLYPDYTMMVQRQRSSVKKKLQAAQLKYALLFPARLKVIHDKKTHFFDSPNEAEEWLEVMEIDSSQSSQSDLPSQGPSKPETRIPLDAEDCSE